MMILFTTKATSVCYYRSSLYVQHVEANYIHYGAGLAHGGTIIRAATIYYTKQHFHIPSVANSLGCSTMVVASWRDEHLGVALEIVARASNERENGRHHLLRTYQVLVGEAKITVPSNNTGPHGYTHA